MFVCVSVLSILVGVKDKEKAIKRNGEYKRPSTKKSEMFYTIFRAMQFYININSILLLPKIQLYSLLVAHFTHTHSIRRF